MPGSEIEPPNHANQPAIVVSRLLNAPCATVFAAWSTVEQLRRSMCPEAGSVAVAEIDFRVGGAFRIDMLVDGVQSAHTGVYQEILPPHRLVFTWASPHTYFRDSLVTVELRAKGDRTELTITQTLLPDDLARERHTRGWTRLLDHLVAYLQSA